MEDKLELLVEEADGRVLLRAPEVGCFTCCRPRGHLLAEGSPAGALRTLGRTVELVVPAGVTGRVVSERPDRVNEPVGWGDVLYELAALQDAGGQAAAGVAEEAATSDAPVLRTPHSGRFWHRSSPGAPPFVEAGGAVEPGTIVGLIEVMKTFTHLHYTPAGKLPERGRVVRMLVADGAEVTEGDPLLEVEPA